VTEPPVPDDRSLPVLPDLDDLGTQSERTELAWVRTTLACAALAVLAVRLAGQGLGAPTALALGALVAAPGLTASWWRSRELRSRPEPDPPSTVDVAAVAASVVLVDVLVLVLILA
jgi:uncharacterized membrane protein YidH (DUF202 family)